MDNNGVQGGGTQDTGEAVTGVAAPVNPEVSAAENATVTPVAGSNTVAQTVATPGTSAVVTPGNNVVATASENVMPAVPENQKRSNNGVVIAVVVAVVAVLAVMIAVLIVVLVNNNSSKSQSNRGSNSHYEEDDDGNDSNDGHGGYYDGDDDDEEDNADTSSVGSINCLGYRFEKQSGYTYVCEKDALTIGNSVFAMYVEELEGLSYYQAEGHADELAAQLGQSVTVKSHKKYTASNGRKMLVFNVVNNGVNMYAFFTAASASSVLIVQVANENGRPVTADLETASDLLSGSTVASRLPEDGAEDEGDVPAFNWGEYLKVPELQK